MSSAEVGIATILIFGLPFSFFGYRFFHFLTVVGVTILAVPFIALFSYVVSDDLSTAATLLYAGIGTLFVFGLMIRSRQLRIVLGGFAFGASAASTFSLFFAEGIFEDLWDSIVRESTPNATFFLILLIGGILGAVFASKLDITTIIVLTAIFGATNIVNGYALTEANDIETNRRGYVDEVDFGTMYFTNTRRDNDSFIGDFNSLNNDSVVEVQYDDYLGIWLLLVAASIGFQYMQNKPEVDFQLGIGKQYPASVPPSPQQGFPPVAMQGGIAPAPYQPAAAPPPPPAPSPAPVPTPSPTPMPAVQVQHTVIISTRGDGDTTIGAPLAAHLTETLPNTQVKASVASLVQIGDDFEIAIPEAVQQADVVILVIDQAWGNGAWWSDASDMDHLAITTALGANKGSTRLIPIFVDNAVLPEDLPDSYKGLKRRAGIAFDSAQFEASAAVVQETLTKILSS